MKDICKIFCLGRITQAPIVRKTSKGDFITFSIAVHDSIKNGENWEDISNFLDIVSWQTRLFNYLEVGKKVAVTGDLNFIKYKSKSGEEKQKLTIKATDIEFEADKKEENENKKKAETPKKAKQQPSDPDGFQEDELPF